ncbi:MAG: EF-P lysine aminoacylase GenX [Rhodospirillaceae bacterium]|nr:EF-P lysine aminoacylase GenX [Rhodospirillaceae bacterium]
MPDLRSWWHPDQLARRKPYLEVRRAGLKAVRAYFQAEGFVDVETPILQVSGGIERHIQALTTTLHEPLAQGSSERALHTSPEFAMKKLLAGGMSKIYQLARVFRDGERSPLHHPEFTMLEWYRANTTYEAMMNDCAVLMAKVAKAAHRTLEHDGLLKWRGQKCDPAQEPERITVAEAFSRHANIDLLATIADPTEPMPNPDLLRDQAKKNGVQASVSDNWEDIFFRVMLDKIEPKLGEGRPTILCEYPACLAALAQRKPGDGRVAERFELYACGVELANAFGELTDAAEQRRRFAHDREMHRQLYGVMPPLDEDFLAALDSGLPPSSGCALGFDRLIMLASHANDITDVLWAPVA